MLGKGGRINHKM